MDVPEVRYAKTPDGLNIAYQVFGEGLVDLIAAGGPAGHVEVWWEDPGAQHFFARLARFARVSIFDRRGTGLSDASDRPPTLEQHMEDLAAVADALGWEKLSLLGGSDAGRMCILFAASFPERVRALCLNGCSPVGGAVGHPGIVAALDGIIEESWGKGELISLFAPSLAADPVAKAFWGKLERYTVAPGMVRRLLEMSMQVDVRPILGAVRVPTLVLHRRDDVWSPIAEARAMAAAIPDARFVELEGTDNTPWTGDIDSVVDEVEEFFTGQRPRREPDRVLATVLFLDIVDSTGHAARLGDRRWLECLQEFYAVLRRHIGRHRGVEVKTLGDAMLATFDGPARAVRCAREAAAELDRLGLASRSGLHTGEVEIVPGDVSGLAVGIAKEIASVAAPSEVWVSRTVRDLVVGSDLAFADRGTHELEGISDAFELYAAVT